MDIYYIILYFFVYGFLGWCTEVGYAGLKEYKFVNRGFLSGPICPIYGVGVTIVIAFLAPYKENLLILYLSSVVLVTLLEGLTGWAMDKIFHNKWWDYSDQPFNIGGYICLIFSLIWGAACVLVMDFIHPLIHKTLTFIPHTLGIVLIVILGAVMFADIYVTASAIFKFNKRLASMEKIAKELHEISEQLGEDIFEKVVYAMEKQETSRQKLDVAAAEIKARTQETALEIKTKTQGAAAELKARYQELASKTPRISRRLVKAFPRMESRNHKLQLDELREKITEKKKTDRREKKEKERRIPL